MKVAAATNYAARALVELAARPDEIVPLHLVAERQRLSLRYLEQIFRDLRAAHLVTSHRGGRGHGGYQLAVPAERLTLAAVLDATTSEVEPEHADHAPDASEPGGVDTLALDAVWATLDTRIHELLSGVSIADLAARRLP